MRKPAAASRYANSAARVSSAQAPETSGCGSAEIREGLSQRLGRRTAHGVAMRHDEQRRAVFGRKDAAAGKEVAARPCQKRCRGAKVLIVKRQEGPPGRNSISTRWRIPWVLFVDRVEGGRRDQPRIEEL